MLFHHFENPGTFTARHFRVVKHRFDVAPQDRQRRPQFVRNIGHEIPADFVGAFQLSNVMKQNDRAGDFAGIVSHRD